MISIACPQIGKEEQKAVFNVLTSGVIAQGPKVAEFEEKFAKYIGTKYAVAVSSGTTALHLALLALGIGPGDEVITTPFTFIASANSILYVGAKPIFVDICEDDLNIDPAKIEAKVTKKTKAILPVHLYGQAASMDEIMKIAKKHKFFVIEDACQSHGAIYKGKKAGSIGDCGCFSFYPTKNMTTGEGGIVTTNNKKIYEKIKILREHGSKKKYYHEALGYNFRMTDIEAAIGIEQLKKLNKFNKRRQENAKILTEGLKNIKGIITPKVKENYTHTFHQYTVRITKEFKKSRDETAQILNKKGIGTGIHYPLPIHKQFLYKKLGYKDKFPIAEKLSQEVLSLPVHPGLSSKDLKKIINTFRKNLIYEPRRKKTFSLR